MLSRRWGAQRKAELASAALGTEVLFHKKLNLNIFTAETRVREHIHRIDPAIEAADHLLAGRGLRQGHG